ncbi:MAG: hypothetical protein E7Z72_01240 [Methanocorpusculum parvum]|nr:hypothetical protein [Methanocorpusculum parvum]
MENTVPDPAALSASLELFNAGKYDEVISFASGTTDPALMLLAARSYAATEKYDIAESLLRSLIRIMPGSSYVHSYLGDVLFACGDEGAEAEYAKALTLDPENLAAVRQYSILVARRGDLRGAIPALRTLVRNNGSDEDVQTLIKTLTAVGEAEEATALHRRTFGEDAFSVEYIEALLASGEYQKALNAALRGWTETKNTAYLRLDLEALSAIDKDAAEKAYRSALDSFEEADIADENVSAIRFSFVLLETYRENYDAAEFELSHLLSPDADAVYHLLAAELAAKKEDGERASSIYRSLIASLMERDADWDTAELVIDRYSSFLSAVRSKEEVAGVISVILSVYPHAVCLAKIGEAYENAGASSQAKDWFYRAYRADFLNGGLAYAGYLKRSGSLREADTVIRYILTNADSISDLEHAADAILNGDAALYQLDKSRSLVQKSLAAVSERLTSKGREMLSAVYLYAAVDALECGYLEDCKWFCLAGIDVLPCYPETISLQDFTDILSRVKGRAIAERPILLEKAAEAAAEPEEGLPEAEEDLLPNLDDREKKLLSFLREHREATEMDLRSVLDTRRVTGIVNSLLAKTAEYGVTLIEKRGVGERGEVYGYIGRR